CGSQGSRWSFGRSALSAGRSTPGQPRFRAPSTPPWSDFRGHIAPSLPGTSERDPSHRPKLVPLCHAHRPTPARPCRGTLRRWRPPQISNPRLLCVHVVCCSPICLARPPRQTLFVLYLLQPLVISS